MTEPLHALLDADGTVTGVIVCEPDYAKHLPDLINDPGIDTGNLAFAKVIDITDLDVKPGVGWKRSRNGRFVAPAPE